MQTKSCVAPASIVALQDLVRSMLGSSVKLRSNVKLGPNVKLRSNVKLQSHVILGSINKLGRSNGPPNHYCQVVDGSTKWR